MENHERIQRARNKVQETEEILRHKLEMMERDLKSLRRALDDTPGPGHHNPLFFVPEGLGGDIQLMATKLKHALEQLHVMTVPNSGYLDFKKVNGKWATWGHHPDGEPGLIAVDGGEPAK